MMMSNPFFAANGNPQMSNFSQMLASLKQNPIQFLMQRKLNVPQSMANDPQSIIQHLLSSGQITQEQINKAYEAAQRFR